MSKDTLRTALDRAARARRPRLRVLWCEVSAASIPADGGGAIPGLCATCPRCGHVTESYGTSERSARRCLVLLREECPRGEQNLYGDLSKRPEPRPYGDLAERIVSALDRIFGGSAR